MLYEQPALHTTAFLHLEALHTRWGRKRGKGKVSDWGKRKRRKWRRKEGNRIYLSPSLPFASGGNSNSSSRYCTFTVHQYFFILRLGRSSGNAESCWRIGGTYSGSELQEFVKQRNPKTYFENSVLHRTITHGRATVIFEPLWWVAKPKNYIMFDQMQWGIHWRGNRRRLDFRKLTAYYQQSIFREIASINRVFLQSRRRWIWRLGKSNSAKSARKKEALLFPFSRKICVGKGSLLSYN